MAFQSRLIRCRFLGALLVALLAFAVIGPEAARAAAPPPRCLGKVATIVGHGTIHGTTHADVIVAGAGADHILGGGGNDRICARGGDDMIEGGGGGDRIEAGPGEDEVIGGNGSDLVLAGPGADTVFGKRGNDRLYGGDGADYLSSGLGDDTLFGGPGDGDQVIGGVGNDHLYGGLGDGDVLEGDYGTDTLDGGPGTDDSVSYALAGSGGTAFGSSNGVRVDLGKGVAEGDGGDTLSGIEAVVGSPFDDTIVGDAEPNQLYGGGGVDELVGGGGDDAGYGGTGLDRCLGFATAESCEMSGGLAYEAAGEAALLRAAEGQGIRPTLEVDLAGGKGSGALTAVVEWGVQLSNKPGIQMHVSFVEGAWIVTEEGVPIVVGEGCTMLDQESARCPIEAVPTGLFLNGSSGEDTITVEPSVPATASATVIGGLGADELVAGAGDDSLDGSGSYPGGDIVRGGPGDDALASATALEGEAGSDLLIASPCGETIDGGPGIDSVSFARMEQGVEATLGATAGFAPDRGFPGGCGTNNGAPPPTRISTTVESIEGSSNDDVLSGDGGSNIILGRGGDDEIHGAGGDDFLVGGEGRDSLYGEGGADRLYARDGRRDGAIDCGSAGPGGPAGRDDSVTRGDVAVADPGDPPARNCRPS